MAGHRPFPPEVVVAVKALACELPPRLGVPLSRLHVPDIAAEVVSRGIVASISGTTIWRWLAEDAIKPSRVRSWIFPQNPGFGAKAGRMLDLYAREWEGEPLGEGDYVVSAGSSGWRTTAAAIAARPLSSGSRAGRPPRLVHLPVRASWINQVGIYFSMIHRKVLTPSDFTSLAEVEDRLRAFERRYEQAATPFEWKFTRHDLALLMKKLGSQLISQAA